jgi:GNAT superfamily N-acetyltransferase
MPNLTRVIIYHLEMTEPSMLRPSKRPAPRLDIRRAELPSPELNRFLYTAVGGNWFWRDRLSWSYERWLTYLNRPEIETWIAYLAGTPAGYTELEAQPGGSVEIAYFGLLPQFIGHGVGGTLLTTAIRRAWATGAQRVWVHTCSLDHPHALNNYKARGMRLFKEEEKLVSLPEETPGPWPGAGQFAYPISIPAA